MVSEFFNLIPSTNLLQLQYTVYTLSILNLRRGHAASAAVAAGFSRDISRDQN